MFLKTFFGISQFDRQEQILVTFCFFSLPSLNVFFSSKWSILMINVNTFVSASTKLKFSICLCCIKPLSKPKKNLKNCKVSKFVFRIFVCLASIFCVRLKSEYLKYGFKCFYETQTSNLKCKRCLRQPLVEAILTFQ